MKLNKAEQALADIAVVMIAVTSGRVTVAQLKKYVELRQREIDAVGFDSLPEKIRRRVAAIKSAIARIEREQRHINN